MTEIADDTQSWRSLPNINSKSQLPFRNSLRGSLLN